ncbi:MAG TPA: hypothetical protein ENJ68_06285, partial [Devosia sp.]|nr:hypothetical protein [Devosia sp.]
MQKTSQYGAYSGPGGPDTHRPDEQRFSSAGSGETAFHAPHPEPLIALGPLFHILWQRKGLIGLVSLVFLALAFLYVALTPPTYTAQGVIVIDPRQNRILNSQGVLSGIGANSAAISSQVEIIQSRNLLEKVFEDNDLINDPEFSQPRLLSR